VYVTTTEVCDYIGWDHSDAATLARVNAMIPVVEQLCDSYLGTTLTYEPDVSKQLLVSETGLVYFPKVLASLTSVKKVFYDGNLSDALNPVGVKLLPFSRPPYRMLQLYSKTLTGVSPADSRILGVHEVSVLGDWGFETIPADIKYALALAVKYHSDYFVSNEFVSTDTTGLSVVEFRDTGKSVNLGLPKMSLAILSNYKVTRMTND
jgi:hypothetical protein